MANKIYGLERLGEIRSKCVVMASKPPPEPIYVLRGGSAAITVLKFAPKSVSTEGLLLSGSAKGILNIWNLKTKRIWMTLDNHEGKGVLAAHFLPSGTIISHGRDGYLKMLQCSEGRSEETSSMQAPSIGFCQFDILSREGHNSHWIAVPSSDQSQVNILDLESKKPICTLIPEKENLVGMCMCLSLFTSPITNKPFLAAGYENGSVMLWDVTAGKALSNSLVHTESVLCMDVDPRNLDLVTGSADNNLCVLSAMAEVQGRISGVSLTRHVELKNPGIASVKIRKDRKIVASGGWDGRLRIYGWKKLSPLAYLSYHTGTINSVDFSENLPNTGQILAAGGKDTRISLWSLYNNTEE